MRSWYAINLGDALLAGEELEQIKAQFLSAYQQAGQPQEMALFIRHESEGRLHCETILFFSPAAMDVAELLDAMPCRKPSPDTLGLLAGSEWAWSLLVDSGAKEDR